jgi:hypothetical protein
LRAEAFSIAGGEEGFSAAEYEEREGLQICWGGFGRGRWVEDLGVGGLRCGQGELRVIGGEVGLR